VNQCRRLLLEAGADPTITLDEDAISFLEEISSYGDDVRQIVAESAQGSTLIYLQESIRLAWNEDLTGHFARIKDFTNYIDESILIMLCKNQYKSGRARTKENLRRLLDLGSDIHVRDHRGKTCLLAFISKTGLFEDVAVTHDALTFLIEKGADVYASDYDGITVSEVAYSKEASNMGSFSGDLWDAALQSCGYDIAEFRSLGNRKWQRKAEYTGFYSRADFETLWEGREKLCPYWDDLPWPRWMTGGFALNGLGVASAKTLKCVRNLFSDSDNGKCAKEVAQEQREDNN
jgi:hypothetical protein